MIKKVSIRENSGSFDELLHIDCVIIAKLIMRRWKVKSKRKFIYLLDNREYTKMRNGDATSPPQVPTLYKIKNKMREYIIEWFYSFQLCVYKTKRWALLL